MGIIFNKNMFAKKQFAKGSMNKRGKFMYWVNFWGFGIIITNTCKGLKYDLSLMG